MRQIVVALPETAMLRRLSPAPDDVTFIVWVPDDTPPPHRIDLLVLPYNPSPTMLAQLGSLDIGLVQSQTLGFNGVAELLPPHIPYANVVGVHEAPTGELAVALILESQRGLDLMARAQPSGSWVRDWHPGLLGCSVLIIGVGGVGQAVASRIRPFGVTLTRVARTARRDGNGDIRAMADLTELLATADIVVIAIPLTEETDGLVDARFLANMKRGSLLVNVSRGAIVDTDALTDRVESGELRAALDVTEPEPLPPEHALWRLPGVIITPHIGGNVRTMSSRVDPIVRQQIAHILAGKPPVSVVVNHPETLLPPMKSEL